MGMIFVTAIHKLFLMLFVLLFLPHRYLADPHCDCMHTYKILDDAKEEIYHEAFEFKCAKLGRTSSIIDERPVALTEHRGVFNQSISWSYQHLFRVSRMLSSTPPLLPLRRERGSRNSMIGWLNLLVVLFPKISCSICFQVCTTLNYTMLCYTTDSVSSAVSSVPRIAVQYEVKWYEQKGKEEQCLQRDWEQCL